MDIQMEQKLDKIKSEMDYLSSYAQENYERPSVAVDMAVFTIKQEESKNYRKLSQKVLSILMIQRGEHPYKDFWALPGGFVRKGETLEVAAYRELQEEAGVSNVYLSQLHSFSEPGRDPRGWIISNSFLALAQEELFDIKSGSDASAAAWFQVEYNKISNGDEACQDIKLIRKQYQLKLSHENITISATIEIRTQYEGKRVKKNISIIESNGIAFDHAKIIAYAINYLRDNLNESMIPFELLPEQFTLTDLQQVFETILNEELLPANFRRKIADYVIMTEERVEGAGHRPSKLFKRNFEKFL